MIFRLMRSVTVVNARDWEMHDEKNEEKGAMLTCFPRITMTSAAPAAVRAHVNNVPRSACTIGE